MFIENVTSQCACEKVHRSWAVGESSNQTTEGQPLYTHYNGKDTDGNKCGWRASNIFPKVTNLSATQNSQEDTHPRRHKKIVMW